MLQLLKYNFDVNKVGDIDHAEYAVNADEIIKIKEYYVDSYNTEDDLRVVYKITKLYKEDMKRIGEIVGYLNTSNIDSNIAYDKTGVLWSIINYDIFSNIIVRIGPLKVESNANIEELINIIQKYGE